MENEDKLLSDFSNNVGAIIASVLSVFPEAIIEITQRLSHFRDKRDFGALYEQQGFIIRTTLRRCGYSFYSQILIPAQDLKSYSGKDYLKSQGKTIVDELRNALSKRYTED